RQRRSLTLYTRPQLVGRPALLGAAGLGLAVGRSRRARPDLSDRLEQFERTPRPASPLAPPAPVSSAPQRQPSSQALIDLNRANAAELTRLPGVGRALATRIVAAREAVGRFTTVDDLQRVRGFRRNTIDRLRPLVTAAP